MAMASMSRRGLSRWPSPAASVFPATVRDAIFGKLGLPLRNNGRENAADLRPASSISTRSSRLERARSATGWARVCDNIAGWAPALGLVVLLAAVAGVGAWRFWPREGSSGPTPSRSSRCSRSPTLVATRASTILGPSFAREVSAMMSSSPAGPRIVSAADLPTQKLANPKQTALDLGCRLRAGRRRIEERRQDCGSPCSSPTRQATRTSGRTATTSRGRADGHPEEDGRREFMAH